MKSGNKRAHIVKSAIKLFARYGFNGVSIKDIASDVGISSPSFYHHFADKTTLIKEVLGELNSARSAGYSAILASKASNREKLKSVVALHIGSYTDYPDGMKIFQHLLLEQDAGTIETFFHEVYSDAYLRISRCAAAVDSSRDGYYTMYLIMSLSIGYQMYIPLQNMIRRLAKFERDTEYVTNLTLGLVIPSVDWPKVSRVSGVVDASESNRQIGTEKAYDPGVRQPKRRTPVTFP